MLEILKKPIRWEDGFVIPPDEPGLGVELNEGGRAGASVDRYRPASHAPIIAGLASRLSCRQQAGAHGLAAFYRQALMFSVC